MGENSVKEKLEQFLEEKEKEKQNVEERMINAIVHTNFLDEKYKIIKRTSDKLRGEAKKKFDEEDLATVIREVDQQEKLSGQAKEENEIELKQLNRLIETIKARLEEI